MIATPAKRSREEAKKNVRFGRAEGEREFVNKEPSPASPGSGFEVPDDWSQTETIGGVTEEPFSEDLDDLTFVAQDPPESHRVEERGNEMDESEEYSRNREEGEEGSTVDEDFSCEVRRGWSLMFWCLREQKIHLGLCSYSS